MSTKSLNVTEKEFVRLACEESISIRIGIKIASIIDVSYTSLHTQTKDPGVAEYMKHSIFSVVLVCLFIMALVALIIRRLHYIYKAGPKDRLRQMRPFVANRLLVKTEDQADRSSLTTMELLELLNHGSGQL